MGWENWAAVITLSKMRGPEVGVVFLSRDTFTSFLINFNNFEQMLSQACVVVILLFTSNTASDAQILDVGRFDIGDTISQAEGALADIQELQQAEVLGLGQGAINAADAAIGDVQQANGNFGLEEAFDVADAALGDVQVEQANGDFGLEEAFDVADAALNDVEQTNGDSGLGQAFDGLGDSQVHIANRLDVRKQDVLGHANSVGSTSNVQQRTTGGTLGQRMKCRLERRVGSGSVESHPEECFKEPECREECDTRRDEQKCTVANERACRTLQEQAS